MAIYVVDLAVTKTGSWTMCPSLSLVLPTRIARVFSVFLQCAEIDAFLTYLIYRTAGPWPGATGRLPTPLPGEGGAIVCGSFVNGLGPLERRGAFPMP